MIGVFAKASVKTDFIEAFEASAAQLVAATRSHDTGLSSYDFGALVEEGAEGEYAFIERWENEAALETHMAQEHFTSAVAELENYLAEPLEVNIFRF